MPAMRTAATTREPRALRAPRFAANCLPCKIKKKRCDRVKPCMNCVLHRCEADCYPNEEGQQPEPSEELDPTDLVEQAVNALPTLDEHFPVKGASNGGPNKDFAAFAIRSTISLALPSSYVCYCLIEFARQELGSTCFFDVKELQRTALYIEQRTDSNSSSSDSPFGAGSTFDFFQAARQMSMLFWTLSYAAQNLPPQHDLILLTNIDCKKSIGLWKRLAVEIDKRKHRSDKRSDTIYDIAILAMQALWYTNYGDWHELWRATGAAIRQAVLIDLFKVSSTDNEEDRCAVMTAHKIVLMDRWIAFDRVYPLGIVREPYTFAWNEKTPTTMSVTDPNWVPSVPLDFLLEQKQIEMLEAGRRVRLSSRDPSVGVDQQRSEALALLRYLNDQFKGVYRVVEHYLGGVRVPNKVSLLKNLPAEHAYLIAVWIGRCRYIACVSCMHFIHHDPDAPYTLRKASLRNAVELLKMCEVYTDVVRSAKTAYSPTRLSNLIFSAVRAILVNLANDDLMGPQDSTLMDHMQMSVEERRKAAASQSRVPQHERSTESHSTRHVSEMAASEDDDVILDDLDDLPEDESRTAQCTRMISSSIQCLEEMVRNGSPVAEKVLQLIMQATRQFHQDQLQKERQRREHEQHSQQSVEALTGDDTTVHTINTVSNASNDSPFDQRAAYSSASSTNTSHPWSAEQVLDVLLSRDQGQQESDEILASFLQVPPEDCSITSFF